MRTILVVGVDSVVGANLAAVLSGANHVVGVAERGHPARSGSACELIPAPGRDELSIRQVCAAVGPAWLICCGPGAESSWDESPRAAFGDDAAQSAGWWARAAQASGADFACVSSDAVFTGPWMFHGESSRSLCDSRQARCLQAVEAAALEAHPAALIVRTNVFGWAPEASGRGWIERALDNLDAGTAGGYDAVRHSTPLLATDFADVLLAAWQAGLKGVYHIAGAERTNPARFVERLACEFALAPPACGRAESLTERPRGFGCGETSLQTSRIRRALGISLPTLAEGLRRLSEQRDNGFRDRLNGRSPERLNQAA
jgi:dTDP-4-dehydrorhamnose reductase